MGFPPLSLISKDDENKDLIKFMIQYEKIIHIYVELMMRENDLIPINPIEYFIDKNFLMISWCGPLISSNPSLQGISRNSLFSV